MTQNAIGAKIEIEIADNHCFGCGQANRDGLRLEFTRTGEFTVQTRFTAAPHLCGAPEVVHGGIQATLLDEVMGVAIRAQGESGERLRAVTAEFNLRYRRPVPVGSEIVVEGRFLRAEGRNRFVEGRIMDDTGEVLTSGEARWVVLASR